MPDPLPTVPHRMPLRSNEEMQARAEAFYKEMDRRRSIRNFSDRAVPRSLIERAIQTASTAPSGAHMQPWTFVAISDAQIKRAIREAAEVEERQNYERRMSEEWLEAIEPLGIDWRKPFLETAPWLVVLFEQRTGRHPDGSTRKHYYVKESCGIAAGFFIAAVHHMGLATLPHTPSPMHFLSEILGRPSNESPMTLFPVGYPAEEAAIPDLTRKPLSEVSTWVITRRNPPPPR